MPLYEHVFLARQDVSAQQVESLTEQFKSVIEANGGTVGKVEYWGVRPLAYRVRKNRKAHYSLINIDAQPAAVAEMERQMRLSDDILRFMTVRVEEHDEEPSAILQRRDERRGGRGGGDRGRGGGERRPRESEGEATESRETA